jgi:hypothetical protein
MEENQQRGGAFKGVLIFLFFLGIALGYYVFIDWALMVHAQNLPFPYK